MKYYCISPDTAEALRTADGAGWLVQEARALFSVEGQQDVSARYLIPADAVINAPPTPEHKHRTPVVLAIQRDKEGYPVARWTLVDDFRGQIWQDENGKPVRVVDFGDPSLLGYRRAGRAEEARAIGGDAETATANRVGSKPAAGWWSRWLGGGKVERRAP